MDKSTTTVKLSSKDRLWTGLGADVFQTSGGWGEGRPGPDMCVIMQLGGDPNSLVRCDGLMQRRHSVPGDIDVIPPGAYGIYEEDGPAVQIGMHLKPSLVKTAAETMGLNSDSISIAPKLQLRDPHIQHIGWALKAELESDQPYDRLYAEELGLSLAIHLLRLHARRTPGESRYGLTRFQLHRIVDYINEHLVSDLSLNELAALTRVSPSHFKSQFKQYTGLPVHKYIVKRRVEYAVELLVPGKLRLSEVAQRAGFADQSHMTRCMRRVTGLTPTDFLRRCG